MSNKQLSKYAVEFDFTIDGETDRFSRTIVSTTESAAYEAAVAALMKDYGSDWESMDNIKIERVG